MIELSFALNVAGAGLFVLVGIGVLALSRGERRGLLVGAAATTFGMTWVTQNFLSAEYGLLMGGVIAGTLLFAVNPIQRAVERLAEKAVPVSRMEGDGGPSPMAGATARRDEDFRNALRLALRDRKIKVEEERQLFRLAETLGIGAARAFELRLEVDAERTGKEVA